jgi:hypothetical protein
MPFLLVRSYIAFGWYCNCAAAARLAAAHIATSSRLSREGIAIVAFALLYEVLYPPKLSLSMLQLGLCATE